jgi:arylsulfatase
VLFINDNGGTAGCKVHNAGMRGGKGSAFNGGTRAMSLWRWPGTLKPAACEKLTAHVDLFPTFAELAGTKVPEDVAKKFDGFSLVPLLENPQAEWHDERMLFTHVGRWGGMKAGDEPVKFGACSVRWKQYLMVYEKSKWCLYDLKADPGEKTDVADSHKDVVDKLSKAYDAWWDEVLPCMENERAYETAPKVNPYKEQYWKQFNGPGPNNVAPGTEPERSGSAPKDKGKNKRKN